MSSWREKFSGLSQRAKEVASSALTTVSESTTDAFKSIKSIAGDVHADVASVVEQIREPKETAQAMTPDGQVYTVAVDSGFAAPNAGMGGITNLGNQIKETAEERELRELKAMIPTTRFMGNTRDELSEVFASITGSLSTAKRQIAAGVRKAWNRSGDDWTDVKRRVKAPFQKTQTQETIVNVPGIETPRAYAPTVMNMTDDSSSDNSSDVKPKRAKRTPPKGQLAYNSSGTGTAQKEYEKRRAAQKAPKPPTGPEDPKKGKRALLAALAIMAGSMATYMYSNGDFDTTNQAPTASAKTPDSTPAPNPTTTENKTTRNETPAPTVTSEPDEPETIEVDPPKEEIWTAPAPQPVNRKYAKTTKLPKVDPVYPPDEKRVELPKEPEVEKDLPSDVMTYEYAMEISKEQSARLYEMRRLIRKMIQPVAIDTTFAPKTQEVNTFSYQAQGLPYVAILKELDRIEDRITTYNTHSPCLPGAEETGLSSTYLNVKSCTAPYVWSKTNANMVQDQEETVMASITTTEVNRSAQVNQVQDQRVDRYLVEGETMVGAELKSVNTHLESIRRAQVSSTPKERKRLEAFRKKMETYKVKLVTLDARVAMIGARTIPSNPEAAAEARVRIKRDLERITASVKTINGLISGDVYLARIQQGASSTKTATQNRTATANTSPIKLRSTTHNTPVTGSQRSKTQNADMKVAPVWTPDSI